MARQSSSEFVNLTLTEFLMVVIFILITLLFHTFAKSRAMQSDERLSASEMDALVSNATAYDAILFGNATDSSNANATKADGARNSGNALKHFFANMEHVMENSGCESFFRKTPLPEVWDSIVAMEEQTNQQAAELNAMQTAIQHQKDKKYVSDLARSNEKLTRQVVTLKNEKGKLQSLYSQFKAKNTDEFVRISTDQLKQYKNLVKRSKRQGVGNPLCWLADHGEKEFLFHIDVMENASFRVTDIYPASRKADVRAIGYPTDGGTRVFTIQQFKNSMQRFWDYGQEHYGCRFFVKVQDRTTTKERWKDGLSLVETYFYKQEVQ